VYSVYEETWPILFMRIEFIADRLFGLVVIVPDYRSRSPGSISGTTRFSEK
jgi:hypothetical protein